MGLVDFAARHERIRQEEPRLKLHLGLKASSQPQGASLLGAKLLRLGGFPQRGRPAGTVC